MKISFLDSLGTCYKTRFLFGKLQCNRNKWAINLVCQINLLLSLCCSLILLVFLAGGDFNGTAIYSYLNYSLFIPKFFTMHIISSIINERRCMNFVILPTKKEKTNTELLEFYTFFQQMMIIWDFQRKLRCWNIYPFNF